MNTNITISGQVINVTIPGKANLSVFAAPTANCQIWSIGAFNTLFNITLTTQEIKDALLTCWPLSGRKNMLLIDIQQGLMSRFEKLVPKQYVMSTTNYVSTRGTNMVIILIKTSGGAVFNELGNG